MLNVKLFSFFHIIFAWLNSSPTFPPPLPPSPFPFHRLNLCAFYFLLSSKRYNSTTRRTRKFSRCKVSSFKANHILISFPIFSGVTFIGTLISYVKHTHTHPPSPLLYPSPSSALSNAMKKDFQVSTLTDTQNDKARKLWVTKNLQRGTTYVKEG